MSVGLHSPYLPLFRSLLTRLGWHGLGRRIVESLPHGHQQLRIADLLSTFDHLKIDQFEIQVNLRDLAAGDCPGLFITDDGAILAVTDASTDRVCVQETGQAKPNWVDKTDRPGKLIRLTERKKPPVIVDPVSFGRVWSQKNTVYGLLIASLVTNLLAFATPLFVMVLYDRLIPVGSVSILMSVFMGLAIAFAGDACIRLIRARAIAHLGFKVDHAMGIMLFQKLMSLPISMLQKTDVSQQISRFRQFEGLRDAFTGSVMSSVLDLPFTLIFLFVIYSISPEIGICVIVVALLFLLTLVITHPTHKNLSRSAALSKAEQQKLVVELSMHQRNLRRLGAEALWRRRMKDVTVEAARASRASRQFGLVLQAFGQTLMMAAGAATIVYGTFAAMNGDMTTGALIASMSLVWRVLSPIHAIFVAAPQLHGFLQSSAQSNRLLQIEGEFRRAASQTALKTFDGAISASGVVFRYASASDTALAGVSFSIKVGECVGISGPNGSGKSTLLNLVDGLYAPQSGNFALDAIDYRQIGAEDLRAAISYAPQSAHFFHGTVAQNLLLNNPVATEEQVWTALVDAGLEQDIRHLPDGIETRLTEELRARMSMSVLRALMLARSYVKDAPIYLFDEPFNGLDSVRHDAFFAKLERLRNRSTVLVVTQRPGHFRRMDRILYMDRGRILVDDAPDAATAKIHALERIKERGKR